ncbi:DUF4331 family protein [Actinoplanes philippinensis]|uniref:DUF4331 family protein n=1 Tax=Actinoplanes philippinensis TaxID=35752 RepID=UPI00340E43D6
MTVKPRLRRTPAALGAIALLGGSLYGLGPGTATASSHREAPLVAADPAVDNTDLYAFEVVKVPVERRGVHPPVVTVPVAGEPVGAARGGPSEPRRGPWSARGRPGEPVEVPDSPGAAPVSPSRSLIRPGPPR